MLWSRIVLQQKSQTMSSKSYKVLGYESQRLSNIWAMQMWEPCTLRQRRVAPRSKQPGWASSPGGVRRLTLGTDLSPAGQTLVSCRQPHPRQWAASGMSQTGHKDFPTARQRIVNAGWQSPWGHLLARGGSQLRGEAKAETKNKHKLRWWVHREDTSWGLSVTT